MRLLRYLNLFAFCTGLFHLRASASEYRFTHFGVRPLGMGNAYIAVADDYNSLFYNPAGLARLKDWKVEVINPSLEVATRTVALISDLLNLASGSGETTEKVLDLFQEQSGKNHHLAFYLTPHFIKKNFGFGIGLAQPFTLVGHSNIDIEFEAGPDVIMPISFAKNFLEDRLSIGASVKLLAKGGIDESFNIQTISLFAGSGDSGEKISSLFRAGYGVGADIGLLFTPIKTMEPTFGLSVLDLGGTPYKKTNFGSVSVGAPASRLPSVNTGVSIKPYQTEKMYILVAMDGHMLNQPLHFSHKLNMGAEFGLGDILKLQTGLNDGYLTAGMQFDVSLLKIRFAKYTVDHAPVVGLSDALREDRYVLQLKLLL